MKYLGIILHDGLKSAMQKTKSRYWFIIKNKTLCTKTFTKNNLLLKSLTCTLYLHVKFGDKNKTAYFLKI